MFSLLLDSPAVGAARLRLRGHLDDEGAREVLHVAANAVSCGCSRLVVDLEQLESYDEDAAYAVVGCARLARWLSEGVGVVTGGRAGRELASHAGLAEEGIMASCPAS